MANAETVVVRDSCLANLLRGRMRVGNPGEFPIGTRYNDLAAATKEYDNFFVVAHPHVTPHSLRRGGATWHFKRFQNIDVVHALGRWIQARTAKLHIDEALSRQ